ncbi:MAG TPA: ABC transporter permease [Bryobacteraceae bacterium]|nr:ABC transporter permease [Bryobacteraceae bacterium]
MNTLFQDLRYALRTLRKRVGFTTVAVTMLALGIGINTAVFSVINSALFKGWPLVQRNDRIVQITTNRGSVNFPDFEDWRSQARSFQGIALIRGDHRTLSDGAGTPETHYTTAVSPNMFRLLGVKPVLGRDFSTSDEQPGAPAVIILRYEVWANRFGANPGIIGKTVRVDGVPSTVIGVMPKGFSFAYPWRQDLWAPLVPPAGARSRETPWGGPYAFARLTDGATIESARAEMETIGRRLASAYPGTNHDVAPVVKGFDDWFIGEGARTLYKGMWAAVGFVLLIVCANVANLLIAHATGRSREIAIRLALGAGRWRIIRQFLIESMTLAMLGGVAGWCIAVIAVRIYALAQLNDDVLRFTIDHRAAGYLIAITACTGILTGVVSATRVTELNINSASRNFSRQHLSSLFVSAEMVLAIVLLAGAGVITRSFLNVYRADMGVDKQKVLMMALGMVPDRYPTPESWIPFFRELTSRLEAIPGVESAGVGAVPTEDVRRVAYELPEVPHGKEQRPAVAEIVASTGYFRTLGARIVNGRGFADSDRASSLPVAIVNQQFAERNWAGQNPVGKRLRPLPGTPGKEPRPWLTVVGVVSNIIQNDRTRQAFEPLVYVPFEQHPGGGEFVFVRTGVAPDSVAAAVRRQVYNLDPNLPVSNLMPLSERLDRNYGFERNIATLFLFFSAVALLLASVGLYASISHSVSIRVQEIGVRVAIGATSRDILTLIFRQGILPVGTGLTIGLAASFALNGVLKALLVGVSPADPIAMIAASALLVLCAALGCWIPARRATRVDPVVALKYQ